MAPIPPKDFTSAPLADWFFISGIDSEQLRWETDEESAFRAAPQIPVEPTIEEDKIGEAEEDFAPGSPSSSWRSKRNSYQRPSRLSDDTSLSIQYLQTIKHAQDGKGTESNRSSTTIRASQFNGTSLLSDVDFDKALRKFASERESFLSDLSLSAGVVVPNRPRARPKTQRIVNEDVTPIRSGFGTIRRKISLREMSSLKRQSTVSRQASIRTSKRLSNYNSVIPNPQPLNIDANMHPLRRKFEPALLDRYPPKSMVEEAKRRAAFPDYVPMFTFPNDINIVSADERPRSTWHGFAMTTSDNSRLYGICIIVWMPLNERASEQLERKCEDWRRKNMTDEERELASSLGERLVLERANLSRLLARLPSIASGSAAREALEDEISTVEEKIGLMADMLRPVRHGAASKIDGLTDGETGFWIPRAYGVLGRDPSLTSFWKEWLRAVTVPMAAGTILRVPASSPGIGMWQPLERYVVNLCVEALSPISSKTQVEIAIRELHLFARKEAVNELPGSRSTDLYALFRALSIPNIVILFEFLLSESRIVLLSSYTSMLHLVSKALVELLYPFTWSGVFIPVLPARLVQAIEAPCPYIVGIERRYENIELPSDDFVLVDLDQDEIESTTAPIPLPRQQRRKLTSLLQVAAPHHNRFGVHPGPPAYAVEAFPFDAFSSEHPSLFNGNPPPTFLSKYAGLNSGSFGENGSNFAARPPVFNAFLQARESQRHDRPMTGQTIRDSPPPSISPVSGNFPTTPLSRNDSGFALQANLREKRSGHFDTTSRRSSSFGMERKPTLRRPSAPFVNGHSANLSVSTTSGDSRGSTHAPSIYAPSTLAASTVMPGILMQPVHDSVNRKWAEGHCLDWRRGDTNSSCSVCDEKAENGIHRCSGCGIAAHVRCAHQICIVCSAAFHPDQIRAAFVRCFASLLYTYRKFLLSPSSDQKKSGMLFRFEMDGFIKSLPNENAEYVRMLQQTQAFNQFIHERETKPAKDPSILLFDEVIMAKRNRGRTSFFSKSVTSFLADASDHLWRTAAANPPNSNSSVPGDYRTVVTRIPAKLDPVLMKEPRVIQGVPRPNNAKARRKPIPSMIGLEGGIQNMLQLASSPPA